MLDEAVQPAADATPTFSFKVANQCDDLWRAMVVPSEQNRGFTENASIEVKRNEEHAMSMRVGDVVVLTNSSGGITAKDFESWERGEGAKLVVIDDCTGVRTTYGRGIR
jgi:hypothetical protein